VNLTAKDPPLESTCHLERRSPWRPKSKDLRLLFGNRANSQLHAHKATTSAHTRIRMANAQSLKMNVAN